MVLAPNYLNTAFVITRFLLQNNILKEFRDNLLSKLKFSHREVAEASQLLRSRMMIKEPSPIIKPVCRDPKDDPILGTAIA